MSSLNVSPSDVRSSRGRRRDVDTALLESIRSAATFGTISGVLAKALRKWAALWEEPGLQHDVTVCYNSRLRATIARWVIASNRLEVGVRFFQLDGDPREVLCHEIAHAVAIRKYGRSVRPHGSEWRGLVREAGYEPKAHSVASSRIHSRAARSTAPLAYEHRCPVCHSVRYGRRAIKSWRCVECVAIGLPGNLTVRLVPQA